MGNRFLKRPIVYLLLFAVSISLSGCFLFGGEEELPDWRVNPTAITTPQLALAHLEWYFELMEFPEDSFYIIEGEEEITAVSESGSRISGFAVYLRESLWAEDISFFFVTRDERLFYNIGRQEVRAGVPLIAEFSVETLTVTATPTSV